MTRFNTQFSVKFLGISLLNFVMASSSSVQFKYYLCNQVDAQMLKCMRERAEKEQPLGSHLATFMFDPGPQHHYYYESTLLTGSEFTYRQTIDQRRGGMLVKTSQPMRAFVEGLRAAALT